MHPVSPAHPVLPTLFDTPYLHFVVTAMGVGNSPALVWADDLHEPTSAIIWDKGHSLYFGGDAHNTDFNEVIKSYFIDNLIPEARQRALGILKFYFANDDWRGVLASILPNLPIEEWGRALYRLIPSPGIVPEPPLPPRMQIHLIDEVFLQQKSLPNIYLLIEEIESCWTSLEHFTDQGFGYCVVDESAGVVSWCTSEYVSPGVCGIGIETLQSHQEQGLATAAAHAFAHHAARLNWQAYWDCWQNNIPSNRVAEKISFQKVTDYTIAVAKLTDL